MCTGPEAAQCPDEQLAWRIYHDHGYRPQALRPCLVRPEGGAAVPARPVRVPRSWRRGLTRLIPRR